MHHDVHALRVYEKVGSGYTDSDLAWFSGTGADTFNGTVMGGLVGQTVSFDLFVLKLEGKTRTLVPTASASTGTYSW